MKLTIKKYHNKYAGLRQPLIIPPNHLNFRSDIESAEKR